jgi:hypothetical protein
MTGKDDEVPVVAVRPFIGHGRSTAHTAPHTTDEFVDDDTAQVRAYAMTRGRSQAAVHLAFETMLQATPSGMDPARHERFERGSILQWCRVEALSVAELAARLRVPIGVVRVVAADLLLEGQLEAFQASEHVADDVLLITRLIAGVRAL